MRFARSIGRLAVVLLLLAASAGAVAQERILDYRIEVAIQPDASLEVTENITVRAEGSQIRRGIYRDFPTRYRDRAGNRVVVALDVLGVERDGQPEPWFTENLSNGVRINTGNDDFLPVPADIRFTLRYRTTRQIGFFAEHDELYWNAIGTGWAFPIDAAQVEVRLPEPVPMAQMSAEGYTGPQGAKGQDYTATLVEPGLARWHLTAPLAPQEGFTIVLGFPKGLLPEPTRAERAGWLLRDNLGVLIALLGLIALWYYCITRWWRIGRDPRAGVVIARYDPPAGRSPSELRFLERKCAYDVRCFTGDLLLLAVNGKLRLQRDSALDRLSDKLDATGAPAGVKRFVGRLLSGRDIWTATRTHGGPSGESPVIAATLLANLLPQPGSNIEFDEKNRTALMAAKDHHAKALKKHIDDRYYKQNLGTWGRALLIALASAVAALALSGGSGVPVILLTGVVMLASLIAFGILIAAPTAEGRRLLDEIEGLRTYLRVAERDELKNLPGPDAPPALDADRYERLLPYAVALDVEEAWTRKFTLVVGAAAAAATTGAISWYSGGSFSNLDSMVSSIGGSLTNSIASASTPPGSSSGGGGGGSSGGGGGGGGGGGR
ncbi:MAG: DUF2207 domain-containing protein [Xanthomonadaceae bacterium]|nr:DUF2207 domain-containing protein [Xanthomonadaceae bacterium]